MQACDFRNSHFFFEIDQARATTVTLKQPFAHNQVRIPLECRCEVTEPGGATTEYILAASCKTERVGVDSDIFNQPNADFCVVCSREDFMIVKRWQQVDIAIDRQSTAMAAHVDRQVGRAADAWTSHLLGVDMAEAEVLASNDRIIQAVQGRRPIVSRTEFDLEDGCRFLVEYPVKTINVSDRHGNYQVDTGPVLFPDLSIGHDRMIGNLRLAYVAHHQRDWAEFIINVPTPVDDGTLVHHYSKTVRVDATNTIIELL